MKHIDEGILHAFLDGALDALPGAGESPESPTSADVEAHLLLCSECQALLEAERAVRRDADGVLRDAGLATVDVPPFEFVAQRHGPAAGAPTALNRWSPLSLAWAASLLVALGAGWWGSAAWRSAGSDTFEPRSELSAPDVVPSAGTQARSVPLENPTVAAPHTAPLATTEAVAAPERGEHPHSEAQMASAARNTEGVRGIDAGAIDAGAIDAGVSALAATPLRPWLPIGEPLPARADAASVAAGEVVTAATSARDAAEKPAGAPAPSVLPLAAPVVPTARNAVQGGAAGRPPAAVAGSDRPGQRFRNPARLEPESAAAVPTPRLPLDAFRVAVADARAGRLSWRSVRPAEAHASGLPLLEVGDGRERVLEVAQLSGDGVLVRVRQTLPDGHSVELLLWREPDARALADGAARVAAPASAAATAEPGFAGGRAVATLVVSTTETPDGGRELLLRIPSLGAFALLSGTLEPRALLGLADALVIIR